MMTIGRKYYILLIGMLMLCWVLNNTTNEKKLIVRGTKNSNSKNVRIGSGESSSSNSNTIISEVGLENIAYHKYVAGQYTYIDEYLSPKYSWIAENWLPIWLTPNSVTLIGGFWMLVAYCITLYQSPNMMEINRDRHSNSENEKKGSIGRNGGRNTIIVIMSFCSICIILYTAFDALDGKQARRTGLSSPFGQILDHGVDALVVIGHTSLFGYYTCLGQSPPYYQVLQSTLQFGCFIASWEEYHTHIFSTSSNKFFGVTEVNGSLALLALMNAFLIKNHNQFWGQRLRNALLLRTNKSSSTFSPLPSSGSTTIDNAESNRKGNSNRKRHIINIQDILLDMELRCATVVLIVIFFSIQMVMSFYRVYSYYYDQNNNNNNIDNASLSPSSSSDKSNSHEFFVMAFVQLLSPFLLATSPIVLLPKFVLQLNTRIVSLAIGFGLALMAIKMNIFSLTKTPYNNMEQFLYFALPAVVICGMIRIIFSNTITTTTTGGKDKHYNISSNKGGGQQQQQTATEVVVLRQLTQQLSLSRMSLIGLCTWQIFMFLSWTLPVSMQIHQHFSKQKHKPK